MANSILTPEFLPFFDYHNTSKHIFFLGFHALEIDSGVFWVADYESELKIQNGGSNMMERDAEKLLDSERNSVQVEIADYESGVKIALNFQEIYPK